MKPFLDLTGASGSVYRFRLAADPSALPATAGNFVWVRDAKEGSEIVCLGTARTLMRAAAARQAAQWREATDLYLRLNVSRETRDGEHEDIVAAVRPPLVLHDFD